MYVILLHFIKMSEARLASETRSGEQREMRSLCQRPTYFQWENGRVVRVFVSDDDSTFAANVKKGVIDLFQLRVNNEQHSEVRFLVVYVIKNICMFLVIFLFTKYHCTPFYAIFCSNLY